MVKMDHQISGTGSAPIDIFTLVATEFINWEVLQFHLKATFLHDLVDSNPKALSEDNFYRTIKTKFQYLKVQGLWSPAESTKLVMEGELAGLNMAMNKMVKSRERGHTGVNGWCQDVKCYQDYLLPIPQERAIPRQLYLGEEGRQNIRKQRNFGDFRIGLFYSL